uniref:Uncharacterized protein n=1 Tax=Lactuca sativa TaxID=4236 RepID=A0A9R1W8K8_LACSA|nr:hypothetical protein LSAT_V11C300119390 [Lactuca sativa]
MKTSGFIIEGLEILGGLEGLEILLIFGAVRALSKQSRGESFGDLELEVVVKLGGVSHSHRGGWKSRVATVGVSFGSTFGREFSILDSWKTSWDQGGLGCLWEATRRQRDLDRPLYDQGWKCYVGLLFVESLAWSCFSMGGLSGSQTIIDFGFRLSWEDILMRRIFDSVPQFGSVVRAAARDFFQCASTFEVLQFSNERARDDRNACTRVFCNM